MRGLAAVVLAAALLLGAALSAVGAEPQPRPAASAQMVSGTSGVHHAAAVTGSGEDRASGAVKAPGVTVDNGESVARGSAGDGTATGAAVARTVSLLDGRVTAYGVRRVAEATTDGVRLRGKVEGLEIDGRRIGSVTEPQTYALDGSDGRVTVNTGGIGLRVELAAAASGLPAGSDLRVAVASARVRAPKRRPEPPPEPTPDATATPDADRGKRPRSERKPDAEREKTAKPDTTDLERRKAPKAPPRLTRGGFAFPVYGDSTFSDTFGAPRQPEIGTHQGTDVFADFGAPVVAVADGTVSKVGTLEISGNRLWLTTDSGDAFFYAHLSAFAPAAVDGREVEAGTVLGFVGNTGDAEPTPPHVHFEIHPGGMEEEAVNPYPILRAWQGRRDVAPEAWLQELGPDATERPGSLVAVRDFIAE